MPQYEKAAKRVLRELDIPAVPVVALLWSLLEMGGFAFWRGDKRIAKNPWPG